MTSAECTDIYREGDREAERIQKTFTQRNCRSHLGPSHDLYPITNPNDKNELFPLRLFVVLVRDSDICEGSVRIREVFLEFFKAAFSSCSKLQLVRFGSL